MYTILLIGAGNIGRRHLQGLLLSPFAYSIYVVDPIAACLDLAKTAVAEVVAPTVTLHTVYYYSSIQQVPTACDVAIIATNADVRKVVVEELLAHTTPRYLILEKVLFQKEADYKTIGQLIYKKNIPTFVNCTRRYFSHYRKIKQLITAAESEHLFKQGASALVPGEKVKGLSYSMTVTGSNWGLACNTIHLLDLFQYLNEHSTYDFSIEQLDEAIIPSKRVGFIELSGTIANDLKTDYHFSASSVLEKNHPLVIDIKVGDLHFIINETEGTIHFKQDEKENLSNQESNLTIPYNALPLSKASYLFVNDLLLSGTCGLTSYFVSAQLHLCLLKGYAQFLTPRMNVEAGIPIT